MPTISTEAMRANLATLGLYHYVVLNDREEPIKTCPKEILEKMIGLCPSGVDVSMWLVENGKI